MEKVTTYVSRKGNEIVISIGRGQLDNVNMRVTTGDTVIWSDSKSYDGLFAEVLDKLVEGGLPVEQKERVLKAVVAMEDRINAEPEVAFKNLVAKRKSILESINSCLSARLDEYNNLIERVSATGVMGKNNQNYYESREADLRKQLEEFDAAHPEVIAKLKSQKAADVNNVIAND